MRSARQGSGRGLEPRCRVSACPNNSSETRGTRGGGGFGRETPRGGVVIWTPKSPFRSVQCNLSQTYSHKLGTGTESRVKLIGAKVMEWKGDRETTVGAHRDFLVSAHQAIARAIPALTLLSREWNAASEYLNPGISRNNYRVLSWTWAIDGHLPAQNSHRTSWSIRHIYSTCRRKSLLRYQQRFYRGSVRWKFWNCPL